MATGWNVMDALNNKTKAAAEDNKTKARFRTKDIAIKQMYSNDKNFYSIPDIEQLAQDILAVGLLENLTVVHDPCDRGEYRIIAGERRWRALTLLVENGYEEFSVASCQIKTPAEEHEEMIQLIIANTYRNKTVADILEEQKKLEETLKHMKEQGLTLNGYKLDSGRLRDVIADMMQVSSTKIAQIESINKKLIPEFTEELKNGGLTFSAAYEISKMSEDIQEDMLEHHREKGLTYKDVKEYAEEQKKAEEEQIDGQLSTEDVNTGACQNLTPEENSDQNEVVMVRVPTEEEREYLELVAREMVSTYKYWFRENAEQITGQNIRMCNELIKQNLHPGVSGRTWVFEGTDGKDVGEIRMYCGYIQLWIDNENRGNFHWLDLTGAIKKVLEENVKEETEKKEKNEEQEEKSEETEEIETPDTYAVSGLEEEPAEKENEYRYQDKEETQERLPEETQLHEKKSGKTDLDIAREENQKYRNYLEMAKGHMDTNDIRVRTYKVMIAALAGYINDLDTVMNPPKEPEQPELPRLKNNDQRKEWLENYKAWGLWYTDKNINVNYYKYDFADGSRLVVAEYRNRINGWNGKEKEDEYYFHLLEKDKKPYGDGKPYDKQYMNATDSETYLVEFLKNLQKNA